jgi:hypothetical protein
VKLAAVALILAAIAWFLHRSKPEPMLPNFPEDYSPWQ